MKINFIKLIEEFSEVEVFLPEEVFCQVYKQYVMSTPQEKGIIVEVLFSLWLRRIYEGNSSWEFDPVAATDFKLHDCHIDVKSTTRRHYQYPDTTKGQSVARIHRCDFNYVLVSVTAWNGQNGCVHLKVHEVLNFGQDGKVKNIKTIGNKISFR